MVSQSDWLPMIIPTCACRPAWFCALIVPLAARTESNLCSHRPLLPAFRKTRVLDVGAGQRKHLFSLIQSYGFAATQRSPCNLFLKQAANKRPGGTARGFSLFSRAVPNFTKGTLQHHKLLSLQGKTDVPRTLSMADRSQKSEPQTLIFPSNPARRPLYYTWLTMLVASIRHKKHFARRQPHWKYSM